MAKIDLSEFEAIEETATRNKNCCAIKRILTELPDTQSEKLRAALMSSIKTESIRQVLKGWGHNVAASTIGRHRRGACACPHD